MRGHFTAAAVGFVGPVFLLKLPSSSHPAESERIGVRPPGPGDTGTPEAARIPPDGVGLLTGSPARHRLSEFSPHPLARPEAIKVGATLRHPGPKSSSRARAGLKPSATPEIRTPPMSG